MSPASTNRMQRYVPWVASTLIQLCSLVWFASHLNATVQQNSKDISQLQLDVEPRHELDKDAEHVKDELADIKQRQREEDAKLDLLLERSQAGK